MKTKTLAIVAIIFLAIVVIVAIASCGSSESTDHGIDSGVVTKSSGKYVTVLEDDGETDKHRVSRSVVRKCSIGKRWPDCKR